MQDEYGTAAYKTVELDDYLHDGATQHREVEGAESQDFLNCFGGRLTYLVSNFRKGWVEAKIMLRPSQWFSPPALWDDV